MESRDEKIEFLAKELLKQPARRQEAILSAVRHMELVRGMCRALPEKSEEELRRELRHARDTGDELYFVLLLMQRCFCQQEPLGPPEGADRPF